MKKSGKYIVILLLGIFILPIAYQPLHTALHHIHGYQGAHSCCQVPANTNNTETTVDLSAGQSESCPICEYQSPVNEVSDVTIFRIVTPVTEGAGISTAVRFSFQEVLTYRPGRAPPVSVS